MSTTYETGPEFDTRWPLAAVAGAVAGLVRPLGVTVLTAAGVDPGVLGLTMQPDLPAWWLLHLGYSFAFGAVYGAVAYRGRLRSYVDAPATGALVGVGFGLALWVVNVLVVWELVVTTVLPVLTLGTDGGLLGPLAGHLVYGAVLGALYPLARRYT